MISFLVFCACLITQKPCVLFKNIIEFNMRMSQGLLQNSANEKNEIDFPERGCLSHFLL